MPPPDPGGEHELVRRVRKLCLAFPRTEERPSHGEPAWFVGGKRMFVVVDHHHGHPPDDCIALWVAAEDGVQRHLLEDDPRLFFRPPYVGARGWVGMWLDAGAGRAGPEIDWDRVEQLVDEAWRSVAGPRLVRAYDAER